MLNFSKLAVEIITDKSERFIFTNVIEFLIKDGNLDIRMSKDDLYITNITIPMDQVEKLNIGGLNYPVFTTTNKDKVRSTINALRCTSVPANERVKDCDKCPYHAIEFIDTDLILQGDQYFDTCDIDQIGLDAADMLEEFSK